MIEVKGLRYRYDLESAWVLKGIDLTIPTGEAVGIVGSNGSGKSTLAKHLNALLIGDKGDVLVDGLSVREANNLATIRQRVGMVFQNPDNQIVATIVEDDVAFGPENLGLSSEEITKRVDWALGCTGLGELRHRSPSTLSGGQRQRLAIASVLAMRPKHIVFDEPTSMLDPLGRDEVLSVMEKLRQELGISIIHITHHMDELLHCSKVIALNEGELLFFGSVENFFAQEETVRKLKIEKPALLVMAEVFKEAGIYRRDACPKTVEELIEALGVEQ